MNKFKPMFNLINKVNQPRVILIKLSKKQKKRMTTKMCSPNKLQKYKNKKYLKSELLKVVQNAQII